MVLGTKSYGNNEKMRMKNAMGMKDDRFLKIVFFDQPSRAKRKAGRPRLG